MNKNKKKTITIEEDGSTITWGSVRVQFNERGIDVFGNVTVTLHAAANDVAGRNVSAEQTARVEPQVGDVMPDGTVYAGISPTTGTRMFALRADAPQPMTWKEALRYAFNLKAHGYKGSRQLTQLHLMDGRKDDGGWRLPTRAELHVLYLNRGEGALKGTFDESGSGIASWYLSSTEFPVFSFIAGVERFDNGLRLGHLKMHSASVRPVRSEPRP